MISFEVEYPPNATDDLRMDEFHKLEQRLIERGLHAAWNLFNTGENDIED